MTKNKIIHTEISESIEMLFCGTRKYNTDNVPFDNQLESTLAIIKESIMEITKDGKEGPFNVQLFIHYIAEK